jgi:2-desacetyl-2-hydroxyethyl bacteriochlorophyllide A dehydrogenase
MRILTCIRPGKMEMTGQPEPVPAPNEVLLKIKKVGICGTDLHAFSGTQPYFTYPRILGHEIAAEIADPNGHLDFKTGDAVTVMPYFHCGTCHACLKGRSNCCVNLKVAGVHADGAMREYFAVPAENVILNSFLTNDQLALIEPFAIGEHALDRAALSDGDVILIIGAGPIGIGIAQLAVKRNVKTIIADTNKNRIDYCGSINGLQTILIDSGDMTKEVMKKTAGAGADIVIDASGNLKAIESGLQYMAHSGKFILVGLQKQTFAFSHPEFHKKETTLMSSRNATRRDFDAVIDFFKTGKAETSQYITHRVSFADAEEAFPVILHEKSKVIKAIIEF